MALCTTAQVFRIEHNCTKEFWSSVLCKLSTYGRVSHWERWEEDARTSQNLYRYLLFNHHILNLHPAFSFVSTITTVVPQMSLDLDAIGACRIWMTIYCRLYFTFHLHIHFRRLFLHLLHRSDVLGPWLHAGPGWREREPKVHEISSSPSSSFYWAIIIWKLTRDEDIQMLGERLPPRCLSFWFPPTWNQTQEIIDWLLWSHQVGWSLLASCLQHIPPWILAPHSLQKVPGGSIYCWQGCFDFKQTSLLQKNSV